MSSKSEGQYGSRRRTLTGRCPECGNPVDLEQRTVEWYLVERTNAQRRRRLMRGGPRLPLRQRRHWEHGRFDAAAYGAHCGMHLIGGHRYDGKIEIDAVGPLA